MMKYYIVPKIMVVELSEALCLNTTSEFADDAPAGAKVKHRYDEWEDGSFCDELEDESFEEL